MTVPRIESKLWGLGFFMVRGGGMGWNGGDGRTERAMAIGGVD
jgi:hypothetical protein